jgi:hypothetical protein
MSDIYLAISETPTVVTLTNAVINSAVASSVTVMNTVTVALDANSLSALENVTVTVGAAITGTVTVGNSLTVSSLPAISGVVTAKNLVIDDFFGSSLEAVGVEAASYAVRVQGSNSKPLPVSGTVTALLSSTNMLYVAEDIAQGFAEYGGILIYGTVTANPTGTQTIAGSVTIGAGTAQIGSVTASISGTVPISISSVTVGNSVTIGSLPAISGTVTANTFAVQGTAVTTSNFTSTTASTVLANFNATREVLTIFNEGAGNLHIAPGVTCTTIAYQVRLSAGDYYEAPNHQTTITHSAVFATAGTARVTEVS